VKVLLAMPMKVMLTASSIVHALELTGCVVTTCDTECEKSLRTLVPKAIRHDFDFVLGCKRGSLLKPFLTLRNRRPDLPLLCWNMDVRPRLKDYGSELLKLFAMVDIMFTVAEGQIPAYQQLRDMRPTVYVPQGCDPRHDNRFAYRNGEGRQSDIFFAGDYKRKRDGRAEFFSELMGRYGHRAWITQGKLIGREHAVAVQRAKICLGWVADPVNAMRSQRDCKILGAGGFLLTRRGVGIESHFKIGEELEVFDTPGECFEKIEYYLARHEERQRIADAGFKAAHERDTYEHHVLTLLWAFLEWRDAA